MNEAEAVSHGYMAVRTEEVDDSEEELESLAAEKRQAGKEKSDAAVSVSALFAALACLSLCLLLALALLLSCFSSSAGTSGASAAGPAAQQLWPQSASQPPAPLSHAYAAAASALNQSGPGLSPAELAERRRVSLLWQLAHRRLLLVSQLRLSAYLQSYRASVLWPVRVEPGDAYLRVSLHPARVWSLLLADPRHEPLAGQVQLELTLQPAGVSRSVRLDMASEGAAAAGWREYRDWALLPDSERLHSEPALWSRIQSANAGALSLLFIGLNSSAAAGPLRLSLSASNGSHALRRAAPLQWPAFPLAYSVACHHASPLSPASAFASLNLSAAFLHFPSHSSPTAFMDAARRSTAGAGSGGRPLLSALQEAGWSFRQHWAAFSRHYQSLYAADSWDEAEAGSGQRSRCVLSEELVLSSPMTRLLQERTAVSHFADLLYLADHAVPQQPAPPSRAADDGVWRLWRKAELLQSLPARRLLPAEKAMLPGHCSSEWWDWYSSYAASHLVRVQQSRSSSDALSGAQRWPVSDSALLRRLRQRMRDESHPLPLKYVRLSHTGTGLSDLFKGLITSLLEAALANRVFALFGFSRRLLLDSLCMSLEVEPGLLAPALLLKDNEQRPGDSESKEEGRQRRAVWAAEPGLGFESTRGYSHYDRVVEDYERRRAGQLLYELGGWYGLSGNIVESRLYRPLFLQLQLNASNAFACVSHALYQLRLSTLLDAHLDVVYSTVSAVIGEAAPVPAAHLADLHPWALRLSLLSSLLRPDWLSVGLQIREGDRHFKQGPASGEEGSGSGSSIAPAELLLSSHSNEVQCALHRLLAHGRLQSEQRVRAAAAAPSSSSAAESSPSGTFVLYIGDSLELRRAVIGLFGSRAQHELLARMDEQTASQLLLPATAAAAPDPSWQRFFTAVRGCEREAQWLRCLVSAHSSEDGLLRTVRPRAWLLSPLELRCRDLEGEEGEGEEELLSPALCPPPSLWLSLLPPRLSRTRGDDGRDQRLALFEQLHFSTLSEHIVDQSSGFARVAGWSSLSSGAMYGVGLDASGRERDSQCWREEEDAVGRRGWKKGGSLLSREYYRFVTPRPD